MMIAFIHVPKVAGASFINLLRRNYGDALYWHGVTAPYADFEKNAPSLPDRYKVVCGHLTIQQMEQIPGDKRYLAFVRHPVERVASLHAYVRRTKGNALYDFAQGNLAMFIELCMDMQGEHIPKAIRVNARQIANNQCYYLSGTETADAALAAIERYRMTVAPLRALGATVGALADELGWKHRDLPTLNISKQKEPIPEKLRQRIAELNAEDMKLCTAIAGAGTLHV
jgi:hypothetical protein